MSRKVKVTFNKAKAQTRELIKGHKNDKAQIAINIIRLIKETISRGQSPVRGIGRFIKYKDVAKYPKDLKKKSPVNLELTGKLLSSIDFKIKDNQLEIGVFISDEATKLKAIQYGTLAKPARPRPVFPTGSQEFIVKIQRDFVRNVKRLFKKTRS